MNKILIFAGILAFIGAVYLVERAGYERAKSKYESAISEERERQNQAFLESTKQRLRIEEVLRQRMKGNEDELQTILEEIYEADGADDISIGIDSVRRIDRSD